MYLCKVDNFNIFEGILTQTGLYGVGVGQVSCFRAESES